MRSYDHLAIKRPILKGNSTFWPSSSQARLNIYSQRC